MDHKTFPAFILKSDSAQGIVESIVAVMGNTDQGDDVIWNGAFTKSITERRGKIRVLDQHQTDSIMRAIGKPLELREMMRAEMPSDLLAKYPTATGGLYAKTQYLMNTPEGRGAFERIAGGAIDEYSIGYDPLDVDYSSVVKADGTKGTVRNLRTIRLYEYSPVLFGMNDATQTLSAKDNLADTPAEIKPWDIFHEGDKWNVYKIDADGKPTGDALGSHDNEEEARAQLAALYASETPAKVADESSENKAGRVQAGRNIERLNRIKAEIEAMIAEAEPPVDNTTDQAPAKQAANLPASAQAGPSITTPTQEMLLLLESDLNLSTMLMEA
jgi:phage head maturation protease